MPKYVKKPMPYYMPTSEQRKAYEYCVRKNIRISPLGINDEPNKWRIGINIGCYKKGENINVSPDVYSRDTIWIEYYKMCKYYYDKNEK